MRRAEREGDKRGIDVVAVPDDDRDHQGTVYDKEPDRQFSIFNKALAAERKEKSETKAVEKERKPKHGSKKGGQDGKQDHGEHQSGSGND
jgi:hypothetical protein